MSAPFVDIVTGETAPKLPGVLIPGRWQARSVVGGPEVRLHGRAVTALQEPVTPGARPEVRWSVSGGGHGTSHFEKQLLPDDTTTGSVREVVAHLGPADTWSHGWERLAALSPLAPGFSDRARLTPLESVIELWLHHLEAVCARPRSRLTVQEERVHVSRAKRVTSRAAEYLASHTEDWHHRTLRGVEPRKILAVSAEDDFDIYENAVVVRLVDRLLEHVSRRIDEVSRVQIALFEGRRQFEEQAVGSHWRRRRIYTLWGQAFSGGDDALRDEVGRTLAVLTGQHRRLLRLLESRLCKVIPRQRSVPATLRMTNILANDQHYRWVARLWLALRAHAPTVASDVTDPARTHRQAVDDWAAFAGVLVVRVLAEFGFAPAGSSVHLRRGGPQMRLTDEHRTLLLTWSMSGELVISDPPGDDHAGPPMRIVPLSASLGSASAAAMIPRLLGELGVLGHRVTSSEARTAVRAHRGRAADSPAARPVSRPPATFLLYPRDLAGEGTLTPRMQLVTQTLQNDLPDGPDGNVALVAVSPMAIDSLERLGRALRWWLAAGWSRMYPARFVLQKDAVAAVAAALPDGCAVDRDGTLMVSRRMSDHEASQLDNAVDSASVPRVGRGDAGRSSTATQGAFLAWWRRTAPGLQHLFKCPVCREQATRRDIEVRDKAQVACTCRACESIWGLRACGNCRTRYPYLRPKADARVTGPDGPGWVNEAYGRDVLAIPRDGGTGEAFQCPWCGR